MINIFITNLGRYTEGYLDGQWVELPCNDLDSVYKAIGVDGVRYEEVFITDYECDIDGLEIGEYSNIDRLNEIAELFNELDGYAPYAMQAYLFNGYAFDEALEHVKNDEYLIYDDCEDFSDLAYIMMNEGYFWEVPENIKFYIDLEKLGQTIECEGIYYFIDKICIELTA